MSLLPRPSDSVRPVRSVLGETVVGTSLVLAGLWFVLLAIKTPLVATLSAALRPALDPATTQVVLAWSAAIAAPMVLVLLGTDRLARILAAVRTGQWRRRDAFATLGSEVVVTRGVTLDDGRPAPTLVVGPFGLAVVHESAATERWEDPRDLVARDAERVRRWLLTHDVDFVVRIYAALVTSEASLTRTTACAVVTREQAPAWIASLPRQRSLSPERCARIVGLLRAAG